LKTAVIHQPDFLPYIGFFHRLLYCDVFIILDNAQFNRASSKTCWHNRDKIKTPKGEKWLTASIKKAPLGTQINKIKLSDTLNWRKDNLNLINENYRKAKYFDEIIPHIKEIYEHETDNMSKFNLFGINKLMDMFDITTETQLASRLDCRGSSNHLLIDILQKIEADRYLSGTGAKAYLDSLAFEKAGIQVIWQEFNHPVYHQCHGEFIPFLTSFDLFFNCGITASRSILRNI